MRIELPIPSWADAAQRAQDDAHTLTLPEPRSVVLPEHWLPAFDAGDTLRVAVPCLRLPVITLTF